MKRPSQDKTFPEVALRLKHVGEYIRIARKRRRMTMAEVAERLNLGYQTIVRIEKGDPGVSMTSYLSVVWLFDLDRQFVAAIHPDRDEAGKALEYSRLPERVGTKRAVEDAHDF